MRIARLRGPLAVGGLLAAWLAVLAMPSIAEEGPEPARKDSPKFFQPEEVALSATVEPARAKPGQTLTYTVSVRLENDWHIYAYGTDDPSGGGPRPTRFDFFQTSGLEPIDDWSASPQPEAHAEPAFNNEVFRYHEGKVSWSRKLRVPDDARPGSYPLRSQISFQICSSNTCKPPVRITVPAVEVTVMKAEEKTPQARTSDPGPAFRPGLTMLAGWSAPLVVGPLQESPDEPNNTPKRKDTPEFLRPKEVSFSATIEPDRAKPSETVSYKVSAKIEEPWHIYDYSATPLPSDVAAIPTTFDLFDLDGLEVAGDWSSSRPPHEADPDSAVLSFDYFEGEVTWSIPLQVPAGIAPGPKTVSSQVSFQICDPKSCKPPARVTVPPAVVTVLPGEGGDVAASPSADEGDEEAAAGAEPSGAASASDSAESEIDAAAPGVATGELKEKIDQGLLAFMGWSALGGVVALLMPCVWPMVPITVNFFVKQGQVQKGKSTTGLAVTYCLAIIAVFTLVGVIFSAVFGAASLSRLANAAWLNILVAGLFIAFGLSLLGVFEIRLPNFLLNASAQGESRGGLVGVIFMALTLTITSFTCTFPVVGALLVLAAGGNYLYPVIGLATFATVLALPFFVLALAPGVLQNLPRSGDWMNAVKVVGGLVEIGAAFKFINTAEISLGANPENAWFDSQVLMAVWVIIALVCGLYLLGIFRTTHDHGEAHVGPGRLLFGTMFLGLGLYFTPALFGYPPKSKIYDRLVVGLLPADADELDAETQIALRISEMGLSGSGESASGTQVADADAADPVARERNFHGVWWGMSYDLALEQAKKTNKPVIIDFTGVNCANCRLMEKSVMPRPEVVERLKQFVPVQLYTDRVPVEGLSPEEKEERATENLMFEVELTNQQVSPLYVVLTPDEKVLAMKGGYIEPPRFVSFLDQALAEYGESARVARVSEASQ